MRAGAREVQMARREPIHEQTGCPDLIRPSRMGRRRAWVLGAVHLVILLHVAHWLTAGRTLSPVEPLTNPKAKPECGFSPQIFSINPLM
jgi:hypothetical protein